jgi:hypothetical protein
LGSANESLQEIKVLFPQRSDVVGALLDFPYAVQDAGLEEEFDRVTEAETHH